MPKYLINELSFIDNKIVQAGEEVETDSPPGAHWEALDASGKKARKVFDEDEAQRLKDAGALEREMAAATIGTALPKAPPQEVASLPKE